VLWLWIAGITGMYHYTWLVFEIASYYLSFLGWPGTVILLSLPSTYLGLQKYITHTLPLNYLPIQGYPIKLVTYKEAIKE
jgi:hypothetical protein